MALDRVLEMDCNAWISKAYRSELSDHMALPEGLVPFEGDVPEGVDVLLAFGGDGTVLEAGTLVRNGSVPILGVNTGRLGFLSNVSMEAFDLAMDALIAGKTWEEERALLHVKVEGQTLGDFPFALNEVVIHKRDTASMVVVDVHREGTFVNTYWADGLLVSTPMSLPSQFSPSTLNPPIRAVISGALRCSCWARSTSSCSAFSGRSLRR